MSPEELIETCKQKISAKMESNPYFYLTQRKWGRILPQNGKLMVRDNCACALTLASEGEICSDLNNEEYLDEVMEDIIVRKQLNLSDFQVSAFVKGFDDRVVDISDQESPDFMSYYQAGKAVCEWAKENFGDRFLG